MVKKFSFLVLLAFFVLSFLINAQIPTNGLVGYWPFNGNANDESGNKNNGTVHGATLTTDRFGLANKAYIFDGTSNYIEITNTFFDNGWSNYTISGWINCTDVTGKGHQIYDTKPVYGAALLLNPDFAPNTLWCGVNSLPTTVSWDIISLTTSTNIIKNNEWDFFTFIKNNNNYKLYINGSQVINSDQTKAPSSYLCGMLLGILNDNNGFSNGFKGKMDDFRIYNRSLTQSEITALYNEGNDLSKGLVAMYPFNGNANDESGNGNNGTVKGATLTADRFGNANKAYSFNGTNNYIETNSSTYFVLNNKFTISCWIKPTKLTKTIIRISDPLKTNEGIDIGIKTDSHKIQFNVYNSGWKTILSNDPITNNQWIYIAVVNNGDNSEIYINNQ
ncbi:MAG: LamG domain-containing protein [Bacteroidales bacterium]|nr:LamG domain-containing protein [Bacteroidales bacterium]